MKGQDLTFHVGAAQICAGLAWPKVLGEWSVLLAHEDLHKHVKGMDDGGEAGVSGQ
jgi:hypothetical protein